MSTAVQTIDPEEMVHLCQRAKAYIQQRAFKQCAEELSYAMYLQPHRPEPHNLFGILLEREGNHRDAMKHFRAALDLDPTYKPAQKNLQTFADLYTTNRMYCFCYDDCMTAGQKA